MPKPAFVCDRCFTAYIDEAAARLCEEKHCPGSQFSIARTSFISLANSQGLDDVWAPSEVVINVPWRPPFNQHHEEPQKIVYIRRDLAQPWRREN